MRLKLRRDAPMRIERCAAAVKSRELKIRRLYVSRNEKNAESNMRVCDLSPERVKDVSHSTGLNGKGDNHEPIER